MGARKCVPPGGTRCHVAIAIIFGHGRTSHGMQPDESLIYNGMTDPIWRAAEPEGPVTHGNSLPSDDQPFVFTDSKEKKRHAVSVSVRGGGHHGHVSARHGIRLP